LSYELKIDIGRISWKLMLLRELTTKIIGVLGKKGLLFPAWLVVWKCLVIYPYGVIGGLAQTILRTGSWSDHPWQQNNHETNMVRLGLVIRCSPSVV
jgi:hypothetical protein